MSAFRKRTAGRRQTGQGGASMVSIGIVLVIATIAIVAVISLGIGALAAQRAQSLTAELDNINATAFSIAQSSAQGYGEVEPAVIARTGGFPAYEISTSGGKKSGLQDIFHGPVYVDPGAAYGAPVDNGFTVTFTNLDRGACLQMITHEQTGGVVNVVVFSKRTTDPGFIAPSSTVAHSFFNVHAAIALCNRSGQYEVSYTVVP